eukprot:2931339-Lingulodinium_polyedra.AAC.1
MIRCFHAPSGFCLETKPSLFKVTSWVPTESAKASHVSWRRAQPLATILSRMSRATSGSSSADW